MLYEQVGYIAIGQISRKKTRQYKDWRARKDSSKRILLWEVV